MWGFLQEILLSSWGYPKSIKSPKKNIYDKLKGQKGDCNWFIFITGEKTLRGERRGGAGGGRKERERKKKVKFAYFLS